MLRVETWLCPKEHLTKELEYIKELEDHGREPMPKFLLDAIRHLRRHGGLTVAGALAYSVGAFLYGFTSSSIVPNLAWQIIGLGMIVAVFLLVPRAKVLRGGCPYALDPNPPPVAPARPLPAVMFFLGLLATGAAITIPVQDPVFDLATIAGVIFGSACLMTLAGAAQADNLKCFTLALRATGPASLLIAFGDGGSGLFTPQPAVGIVASVFTALGACTYAIFLRDIVDLYMPKDDPPASSSSSNIRRLAA